MNDRTDSFDFVMLENTVRGLCQDIAVGLNGAGDQVWSEEPLRRELVACILGSQVRFETASEALNRLEGAGLLEGHWWNSREGDYEAAVFEVLDGRGCTPKDGWRYRFPQVRARQLAGARNALVAMPLQDRLAAYQDAKQLRGHLVREIPGIGPKQASMFLRNVGRCYELAVLDTHVMRFLDMRDGVGVASTKISSISAYERVERDVEHYANSLGYSVGCLDLAIWATMRAARELRA